MTITLTREEAFEIVQMIECMKLGHKYEGIAEIMSDLLRTRLAQPEPEPQLEVKFEQVANGIEVGYDFFGGVDIRLGGDFVYVHINYDPRYTHNAARTQLADKIVGLLVGNTAPPQREWQGLTDEEIMSLLPGAVRLPPGWSETVRAIEAKLKEKNR